MNLAFLALCILWLALIAYAVFGGADFGAGIWDFFAVGDRRPRLRELTNHAIGPVWESNHVWLIFLIVGLFTVFPPAFAALSIALFVPLTVALIGIVLRGAAFIFRTYELDANNRTAQIWSRIFSIASLVTPFFLGAAAAAVASGHLVTAHGVVQADMTGATWLSPFAIVIGAMAVALCASLAAIYLTQEANLSGQPDLAETYRVRALISGAITALLGAIGLVLSPSEAPLLWNGMFTRVLPLVVVVATMLIGLATAALLYWRRYRLARILIILEVAFLLGSWGLSQYPYLIPPQVTIANAANDPSMILALLISIAVGMAIVLPSLYYLFSVFKLPYPVPGKAAEAEEQVNKIGSQGSEI
jgi:cytochrome d ubiquinol oxidase subunit II